MMGEFDNRDMAELEDALASLRPKSGAIERDQLMFRAGRATARRQSNRWRLATGVFAVLAVALGALLTMRPVPEQPERIRYVERTVPRAAARRRDAPVETERAAPRGAGRGFAYLELRERVLTDGVGALPSHRWAAGPAVSASELMDDVLPRLPGQQDSDVGKTGKGEERT